MTMNAARQRSGTRRWPRSGNRQGDCAGRNVRRLSGGLHRRPYVQGVVFCAGLGTSFVSSGCRIGQSWTTPRHIILNSRNTITQDGRASPVLSAVSSCWNDRKMTSADVPAYRLLLRGLPSVLRTAIRPLYLPLDRAIAMAPPQTTGKRGACSPRQQNNRLSGSATWSASPP